MKHFPTNPSLTVALLLDTACCSLLCRRLRRTALVEIPATQPVSGQANLSQMEESAPVSVFAGRSTLVRTPFPHQARFGHRSKDRRHSTAHTQPGPDGFRVRG